MVRAANAAFVFILLLAASDLLAYHFGFPISINCKCSGGPCESVYDCHREALLSWILQPIHLTAWFTTLVFAFTWAVDNLERLLAARSGPFSHPELHGGRHCPERSAGRPLSGCGGGRDSRNPGLDRRHLPRVPAAMNGGLSAVTFCDPDVSRLSYGRCRPS